MIGAPPSARPIRVIDSSSVGEARRHALAVAEHARLDVDRCGKVSIIATELAVNLHLHGGGGELLVSPLPGPVPGVQLLAIDRGKGMYDIERCLTDGYSTAGTAGQGLGAIRRLSTHFDLHSQARTEQFGGTVVLSQVLGQTTAQGLPTCPEFELGAVCVPLDGETVCGDGWTSDQREGRCTVLVADGLGHGILAAEASEAALNVFRLRGAARPAEFMALAHTALRPTRGAAAALAEIDPARGTIRYAGVGNIAGRVVTGETTRSMISHNGTLGLHTTRSVEAQYTWPVGGVLVMASDGLLTNWSLDRHPGLTRRHPAVVAAVLYRDWSRGRDDTTVVVARAGRLVPLIPPTPLPQVADQP